MYFSFPLSNCCLPDSVDSTAAVWYACCVLLSYEPAHTVIAFYAVTGCFSQHFILLLCCHLLQIIWQWVLLISIMVITVPLHAEYDVWKLTKCIYIAIFFPWATFLQCCFLLFVNKSQFYFTEFFLVVWGACYNSSSAPFMPVFNIIIYLQKGELMHNMLLLFDNPLIIVWNSISD